MHIQDVYILFVLSKMSLKDRGHVTKLGPLTPPVLSCPWRTCPSWSFSHTTTHRKQLKHRQTDRQTEFPSDLLRTSG